MLQRTEPPKSIQDTLGHEHAPVEPGITVMRLIDTAEAVSELIIGFHGTVDPGNSLGIWFGATTDDP